MPIRPTGKPSGRSGTIGGIHDPATNRTIKRVGDVAGDGRHLSAKNKPLRPFSSESNFLKRRSSSVEKSPYSTEAAIRFALADFAARFTRGDRSRCGDRILRRFYPDRWIPVDRCRFLVHLVKRQPSGGCSSCLDYQPGDNSLCFYLHLLGRAIFLAGAPGF